MGSQVNVRLDEELEAAIECEREQGPYKVPRAEVVRGILRQHLTEKEEAA